MDAGVQSEPEDAPAEQHMEFEQDIRHANNAQYCVEYVQEIFEHLIATENKLLPSNKYMETVCVVCESVLLITHYIISPYNAIQALTIALRAFRGAWH